MNTSRLAAVAAARLVLGGCASSPEEDPVQIRMNDLDARVQRIERVLTNQSLLELAQRIDALQAELRTHARRSRGAAEPERGRQDADAQSVRRPGEAPRGARDAGRRRVGARRRWQRGRRLPAAGGSRAGQLRRRASTALKGGDYPQGDRRVREFVATYPDSPLASNAQYWLGEAYYVKREYPKRHHGLSQGARPTGRIRARRRTRW